MPKTEKHSLGDILGLGLVSEDPSGQSVHGTTMSPIDLRKRYFAVAGNGGDELGITDITHSLHARPIRSRGSRQMTEIATHGRVDPRRGALR